MCRLMCHANADLLLLPFEGPWQPRNQSRVSFMLKLYAGLLLPCTLLPEPVVTKMSSGRYGFIKYKEKDVADKAMETLHQQSLSQFPENKVGHLWHVFACLFSGGLVLARLCAGISTSCCCLCSSECHLLSPRTRYMWAISPELSRKNRLRARSSLML